MLLHVAHRHAKYTIIGNEARWRGRGAWANGHAAGRSAGSLALTAVGRSWIFLFRDTHADGGCLHAGDTEGSVSAEWSAEWMSEMLPQVRDGIVGPLHSPRSDLCPCAP